MDANQTDQLLQTARGHLADARKAARGPRNDEAILKGLTAAGEIEQVARDLAARVAALEAVLGDLGTKGA